MSFLKYGLANPLMTIKNFKNLSQNVFWTETKDAQFPYEAKINGETLRLRINDFPEEQLYTLFINDRLVFNIDDLPPTWKRP